MFDSKLLFLLIVCVVFMVWLGVEGFALFKRTPQQMMALKFGLGKVTGTEFEINKTASDFANETAYRSASIWQALNMSDKQNIYKDLMDGKISEADIRRMDRDSGSRPKSGPAKWLNYYDATDYSASSPDMVYTSSGSYLQKKTGSRWNDTSYVDTQYFDEDAKGGRHLVQCNENDFNCLRNLTWGDPNYQPFKFGGTPANAIMEQTNDPQVQRAIQVLQQQVQQQMQTQAQTQVQPAGNQFAPSTIPGVSSVVSPPTDIPKCISDCLLRFNITSPTTEQLRSCFSLCSTNA